MIYRIKQLVGSFYSEATIHVISFSQDACYIDQIQLVFFLNL
jgi:hypothetical protein